MVVQPSDGQRQAGRCGIARTVIAAATLLLAFAFAVPASAETTESLTGIAASAAKGAVPTTEETPATPAEDVETPSSAPEPAEMQVAPDGGESTSAAQVESSASVPPPPVESNTAVPAPSTSSLPAATAPDAADAQAVERTSGLVDAVRQAPAATAAPVMEATATPLIGHAAETGSGHALLERADRTLRTAAELLSLAATPVHEILGPVTPPIVEGLLPSASAPVESDSPAAATKTRSFIGVEVADPVAEVRAAMEGSPLAKYLGAFGGIEASRPEPGGAASSAGSSSQAMPAAADVYLGSVTDGRPSNAPPDRPTPPFRSPGAASGSGGSFFVPLAALLALLALAAPATLRRRMEVPDFPAPTLFVCALERPG